MSQLVNFFLFFSLFSLCHSDLAHFFFLSPPFIVSADMVMVLFFTGSDVTMNIARPHC